MFECIVINIFSYPLIFFFRISCYSKAQRSAALATKSCDNIYSKQVRVTDPDLTQWTPLRWGDDSTRSAETLCNNNSNANLSTRFIIFLFIRFIFIIFIDLYIKQNINQLRVFIIYFLV